MSEVNNNTSQINEALFEELKDLISEKLEIGVPKSDIVLDASFRNDLGVDSLASVQLVISIEDRFGINIPDDDDLDLSTVKKALLYVQKKLEEKDSI